MLPCLNPPLLAGHYVVQQHKVMEIVMPEQLASTKVCTHNTFARSDRRNFCTIQLTPYVAYNAPHVKVPPHSAVASSVAEVQGANER